MAPQASSKTAANETRKRLLRAKSTRPRIMEAQACFEKGPKSYERSYSLSLRIPTIAGLSGWTFSAGKALRLVFRLRLRSRQNVAVSSNPNIEGWQEKDAQKKSSYQAANDHDRKRALRVGTDAVRKRRR